MKALIKKIFRTFGIEIKKYKPGSSDEAKIKRLFNIHSIDLVLDVGANTGQYGQNLRDIGYRGRIISFEPLSSVYSQLMKRSRKDDRWKIAPQMVVGDKSGEVPIKISRNTYSSSVLGILPLHTKEYPESEYIGQEIVQMKTLDSLLDSVIPQDISHCFLKIDVQGFEDRVLKGAKDLLTRICGVQLRNVSCTIIRRASTFRRNDPDIERVWF